MRKILKYQTPAFGLYPQQDPNQQWMNSIFKKQYDSLDKTFNNVQASMSAARTGAALNGIYIPSLNTQDNTKNLALSTGITPPSIGKGSLTTKPKANYGDITGYIHMGSQLVDPILKVAGAKEADNISGGEELFSGVAQSGIGYDPKLAAATGGISVAVQAGLQGLDWLNRYAGKTAKQQGTIGLDTGAYAFNLNNSAGKKQTLLGTWRGKVKNANRLTNYYDQLNLKAGQANYLNSQNQLASMNSMQDVASKNQQQLYGNQSLNILAAKKGAKINPAELRTLTKKAKRGIKIELPILEIETLEIEKFENGGKMNVIPEGALHARKHNIQGDLAESVTDKGIPVVTFEEGGEITQHAEIEVNEIIFNKETTLKLEDLFKQYNDAESQSDKNKIAIEAGRFLTYEILENTDDRTGLLNTIE